MIKEITPLRRVYYWLRMVRSTSQSDEGKIIAELARKAPRTFVEFGFHPIEFNCVSLAGDASWYGLLIDGNLRQVEDARWLLPERIRIVNTFLTVENLDFIRGSFSEIGVLSIDVDGNDYWFLERLIDSEPAVICVEYNASMGLESITVPYDPSFDRDQKHPSGWYHGASLMALSKLCASRGYGLAAISSAGANAFFTKKGKLDPKISWRPNALRNMWSNTNAAHQWDVIKHLPFCAV